MKIIFLLVFFLVILFLYLKIKKDLENFTSIGIDAIDSVTKQECKIIVDTVLLNMNKKINKHFQRGQIDRVEKTMINENTINYKIDSDKLFKYERMVVSATIC